jgi:hypothetical protein
MLLFSPILTLAAHYRVKRLYQWFNHILPFGTILNRASGHPERLISGASDPILLKTSAYKWYREYHARLPKKSRVAENTGFRSWGMALSNQHFCNVRRILDTNTRTT